MDESLADKLGEYLVQSQTTRAKMQLKLLSIFTETTGYRPEDLCLIEQQYREGLEIKTMYYFDLKHRHQVVSTGETP